MHDQRCAKCSSGHCSVANRFTWQQAPFILFLLMMSVGAGCKKVVDPPNPPPLPSGMTAVINDTLCTVMAGSEARARLNLTVSLPSLVIDGLLVKPIRDGKFSTPLEVIG